MNRGFLIMLIPAVLVAIGYLVAFHYIGVTPGYVRLVGAMIVFFGGIWWLSKRVKKKTSSANTQ